MIKVAISEKIRKNCPQLKVVAVQCNVENSAYNEALWQEIDAFSDEFRRTHAMPDIKNRVAIAATRQAYKQLGKEPNRYRPSAEALCRRIVKGEKLYQISTLVDLINLISLKTGYSSLIVCL